MRKMRIARSLIYMVFNIFFVSIFMTVFAIGQEKYPSKPITLVVGFAAGGALDVSSRAYGKAIEKILKQPVIIINKPGAGTSIQLHYVKTSLPDGYTLGVLATGGIVGEHLREVPYELFKDFTHLNQFVSFPTGIAVHSDSPWKTLKEFVEYAQKNPGKLKYASTEPGSASMMLGEQLALHNGFKWVHVSFPGDGVAAPALLGKHVDALVLTPLGWGPFAKAGKFRVLGVFVDNRLKEFPDIPTVKELGFKYYENASVIAIYGILAPKGLPMNVQEILQPALREAWKDSEFQEILEKNSLMPVYQEGEEWIRHIKDWVKEAVSVMKKIGLKIIKE